MPAGIGCHGKAVQYHVWAVAKPFPEQIVIDWFAVEYCAIRYDCALGAQHISMPAADVGFDVALRRVVVRPLFFAVGKHFVAGINDDGHYARNVGYGCLSENEFLHWLFHVYQFVFTVAKSYFLCVGKASLVLGVWVGVVEMVVVVVEIGMSHLIGKLAVGQW